MQVDAESLPTDICLLYDPTKFRGFQQPPALNLAQTFLTPDACTQPGTLYTNYVITNGVKTYSCECLLGYTGQRCQFRFIDSSGGITDPAYLGLGNTLPPGFHLQDRPIRITVDTNLSTKSFRFVWGYIDTQTPDRYTIMKQFPFVYESPIAHIKEDSTLYGYFTELITYHQRSYHATLSPLDSFFTFKSPNGFNLPSDITCLTLLSYEVNDNHININPILDYSSLTDPLLPKFEPVAQFTIFKRPSDFSEYIPNFNTVAPPGDCLPPYEWQIYNQWSSTELWCICAGGDRSLFGSNCEYRIDFIKPDIYRSGYPHSPQYTNFVPIMSEFEFTITALTQSTIDLQGVKFDYEFLTGIKDVGTDIIDQITINGNIATIKTSLFTALGSPSQLGDIYAQYMAVFMTFTFGPTQSPLIHRPNHRLAYFAPSRGCEALMPEVCSTHGSEYCIIPSSSTEIPSCKCRPGYYGASCRHNLIVRSLVDIDLANPTTLTMGSQVHLAFVPFSLQTSFLHSILGDLQADSEVITVTVSTSGFDSIGLEDLDEYSPKPLPFNPKTLRHYMITIPPVPEVFLPVDLKDLSLTVTITSVSRTTTSVEAITFPLRSQCDSNADYLAAPSFTGIAACLPVNGLICRPGWYGTGCMYNLGPVVPDVNSDSLFPGWGEPNDSNAGIRMSYIGRPMAFENWPIQDGPTGTFQLSLTPLIAVENSQTVSPLPVKDQNFPFSETGFTLLTFPDVVWSSDYLNDDSSMPFFAKITAGGTTTFLELVTLLSPSDIASDLLPAIISPSLFIRQPPCHPPNTVTYSFSGLVNPSYMDNYCLCKPGFAGQRCGTSYNYTSVNHLFTTSTLPGHIPPSQLLISNQLTWFDTAWETNGSDGNSLSLFLTNQKSMEPSTIQNLGRYVGLQFGNGSEKWRRVQIPSTKLDLSGQYYLDVVSSPSNNPRCLPGTTFLQIPSFGGDRSSCQCTFPYVGERCEMYIIVSDKNGQNISPIQFPSNTHGLKAGDVLKFRLGSILPLPYKKDEHMISASIIVPYADISPTHLSFDQDIELTLPMEDYRTTIHFSTLRRLLIPTILRIEYESSCKQVYNKFGQFCPNDTGCDPNQQLFTDSCPETCPLGLYSRSVDFKKCVSETKSPISRIVGPKVLLSGQFMLYDIPDHLSVLSAPGYQYLSFTAQVTWPGGSSQPIPLEVRQRLEPYSATNDQSLVWGFPLPVFSQATSDVIITITEQYEDENNEPASVVAVILNKIMIEIDQNVILTRWNEVHGDISRLGSNSYAFQPLLKCNEENTLRYSFDEQHYLQYNCICKVGWTGPQCDIYLVVEAILVTEDELPTFSVTFMVLQSFIDSWIDYGFFPSLSGITPLQLPIILAANTSSRTLYQSSETEFPVTLTISSREYKTKGISEIVPISTPCTGTTCNFENTVHCDLHPVLSQICHCKWGWFGPTCDDIYTNPISSLLSIDSIPLFFNALVPGWQDDLFYNEPIQIKLPSQFALFTLTRISLSPTETVDFLPTEVGSIQETKVPITDPSFMMSVIGLPAPFFQIWQPNILTSCDWLQKFNSAINPNKSCHVKGTQDCDVFATSQFDVCTCREPEEDLELKAYIFYIGDFCQTRVAVPMGPYYHDQIVLVHLQTPSTYNQPSTLDFMWRNKSTEESFSLGASLYISRQFDDGEFIFSSWQFTVQSVGPVDQQPPPFQTDQQLEALGLSLFESYIRWSDGSGTTEITSSIGSFRVVDPCQWAQITQHHTICAEEKDGNGEYIAVESCINPETHTIECKCKSGYHLNECRYYFNIDSPPAGPNGETFLGQYLTFETRFLSEPRDALQLYFPPAHSIQLREIQGSFFQQGVFPLGSPLQFFDKLGRYATTFTLIDPLIQNTYLETAPSLPFQFVLAIDTINPIPRWIYPLYGPGQDRFLRSRLQPQSCLDGTPKRPLSPIQAIPYIYGIECPNNFYGQFGCICGHFGVFGPNCGFKIIFNPISLTTGFMGFLFSSVGSLTLEYHIEEITPLVPTPPERNWSFPQTFHFETFPELAGFFAFVTPLQVSPGPIPNSIEIPDSGSSALHLVNDDPNAPIEMKRFQIFHEFEQFKISSTQPGSIQSLATNPATNRPRLICSDVYFGDNCQWVMGINTFTIPIPERMDFSAPPQVSFLFTYPRDSALVLASAYLIRAQSGESPSDVPYQKHQFVLSSADRVMTYDGSLHNFDTDHVKYHLVLATDPDSQGVTHEYTLTKLFTAQNPPCSPTSSPSLCPIFFSLLSSLSPQTKHQFQESITNHSTKSPLTIIHTGTQVSVQLPDYSGYKGNITITLNQYQSTSTPGQYSNIPTVITTRTITYPSSVTHNNSDGSTTIILKLPTVLVATKLFYSISFSQSPSQQPTVFITPTFSTVAQCQLPPTLPLQHADRSKWLPDCNNHGQCSSTTQQCNCSDGWEGIKCATQVIPCQQCPSANILQCKTDNTCECKPEWGGMDCTVEAKCLESSQKKCSGVNGQLAPPPASGKCSNECICNNFWIGSKCSICNIKCLNNGAPYRNCDQCGCDTGFSGDRCQCQSVVGKLTINGYNPALVHYAQILGDTPTSSTDELSEAIIDAMLAAQTVNENVNDIFTQLLTVSTGSIQLALAPIPAPSSPQSTSLLFTNMIVTITFNCAQYNPGLSLDQLQANWTNETGKILKNDQIKEIFIFPTTGGTVTPEPLEPVDPTLPEAGEGIPINGPSNGYHTLILLTVVSITSILFTFF